MTNLSSTQVAQLTALVTGGGYKRAATKDAAIKRFVTVATEAGIEAPADLLNLAFDEAQEKIRGAISPVAAPNAKRRAAIELAEQAAPAPEAKEKPAKAKADKPAKSDEEKPDYRIPAKVDAIMIDLLRSVGPAKVGAFRAEWIKRDPEGYARLAPTQQKGIMRKALNRLVSAGKATRNGSIFAVAN